MRSFWIIYADLDDETLFANTPAQADFLLYILEQAARRIGLYVNSNKTVCVLVKIVLSLH